MQNANLNKTDMAEEFEKTYKALFRRYYAGLLFYAARLVGEDDAEDIVQA